MTTASTEQKPMPGPAHNRHTDPWVMWLVGIPLVIYVIYVLWFGPPGRRPPR